MTSTQERALRPLGDGEYAVLLEGEQIGRVSERDDKTHPWIGFVGDDDSRLGIVSTTKEGIAKAIVHRVTLRLREKAVADLTDAELGRLITAERHVSFEISMSDAIGTAAQIRQHSDRYLRPLTSEARKRGLLERFRDEGVFG